jgi:nitroreductase
LCGVKSRQETIIPMNKKKSLKRLFTPEQLHRVKRIISALQNRMYRILSRSRRLSSLYWGFFSTSFANEHYAIVCGLVRYTNEHQTPQAPQYLLRRNIHRLEKGLLMRQRRDVFALDYIGETVDRYAQVMEHMQTETMITGELQWAHSVLKQYFEVIGSHRTVDEARERFQSTPFNPDGKPAYAPHKRDLESPCPVTYDDLLALSLRRRSVRWYLPQPVPRALIDKAIAVAALAPSACNRQPFEFRVFDTPALVQQVASLPGGTAGFLENLPVVVVLVGKLGAYFSAMDRHLIYIDASLAAMGFMYALETLGLSSCAINWQDECGREARMARLLELTTDERVVMLISIGYPDPEGLVASSQKKELDLLRRYV